MGENLDDLGHGDAFLDTTLNTGSMKERKLDFIKIIFKKICPVEDNSKSTRRQATDWEKIFVKSSRKTSISASLTMLKPF